jgi:hypothetical protein
MAMSCSSAGGGLRLSPSSAANRRASRACMVTTTGARATSDGTTRKRGVVSTTVRRNPSFARASSFAGGSRGGPVEGLRLQPLPRLVLPGRIEVTGRDPDQGSRPARQSCHPGRPADHGIPIDLPPATHLH